jgi:hypothetical protein
MTTNKSETILTSNFTEALSLGKLSEDQAISYVKDLESYHGFAIIMPKQYIDYVAVPYDTKVDCTKYPGYENSIVITNKEA